MAKRKRLTPAPLSNMVPDPELPAGFETKARDGWVGVRQRGPIADVAGDAAAQSAFEEVAEELRAARAEGRMVLRLPLSAVDARHLVRDRIGADPEEMEVLKASLRARGQQTPIEVVELPSGGYGLISGWRRLTALEELRAEDPERFGTVQALVRAPDGAAEAYCAMVEENEIRADLSFYERAAIAVKAAEAGVYPDARAAVQSLFAAARAPKRSKIVAFTGLVRSFDDVLRFPTTIPEKLGLSLIAAGQADPGFAARLRRGLAANPPPDAATERRMLDAALKKASAPGCTPQATGAPAMVRISAGLTLLARPGSLRLEGKGVDDALIAALRDWLAERGETPPGKS